MDKHEDKYAASGWIIVEEAMSEFWLSVDIMDVSNTLWLPTHAHGVVRLGRESAPMIQDHTASFDLDTMKCLLQPRLLLLWSSINLGR